MLHPVSRIALASAILALGAQPAWAIDAEDFGIKLKATVKLLGFSVDYASASVEGDTVTLSDFTLGIPGEDDVDLPGALIFTGVSETSDGGYAAQSASIEDIEIDDPEDGIAVSFRNVAIEGIVIPGTIDFADLLPATMSLYETISAGPLSVSIEGEEVFAIDSMSTWIERNDDFSELVSGISIEGIRGDLSVVPDAEAQEVIAAFGLEQFNASMTGTSSWFPESGRATLDDFAFAIDDLATLRMSGSVLGYTKAFYQDLMKINVKMADLLETEEGWDHETMAQLDETMMALFSDVEIERASLRYEDASLFMKILDFVGAEQGVDGATFANGLKFMVPMMLTEVPDADFRASVTQAVNAFIDNPQSFEIIAEPESPVSFDVFATAEEDPFALVDLLNVSVRANQ